jgi:putative transcriptional regulator
VEGSNVGGLGIRIAGEITMSPRPYEAIRKWRRIFEVSQVELANQMGVSPSVISDYESGRRHSPRADTIKRILDCLFEIDQSRGGRIAKSLRRMMLPEMPPGVILDIREFSSPIKAMDVVKAVEGEVVVGQDLLDREIFGYTVIDSVRAIVELKRDDFLRFYGLTSERALVFTGVATGRSPFVAIKVGGINPSLVIFHGPGLSKVDELGMRIAASEKIPVVISRLATVAELGDKLRKVG